MPSTGMRDAVAMPIASSAPEPISSVTPITHPTATAHTGAESVIGKEDHLEGTLKVQRGLRVLGRVEGHIEAATSVMIEEGAVVEADLTADEAIISGEYSGKLVCRQRLEVRSTGRVKGEIDTLRLMLHEGGFIDGALHMQKPAPSGASSSASATDAARGADSLRSGISPRSTTESMADSTSTENGREAAGAGARSSSSTSTASTTR